jgi:hypothetical protein
VGFYGSADNIFGRGLTLAGCTTAAHITGGFESVRTSLIIPMHMLTAIGIHGRTRRRL